MAMLNNQRVNILTICRRYLLQKSDVLMYRLHTGPLQCCCEITAVCRWNPDACWFCLAKFMAKSIKRPILISGWNQRMFPLKPSDPSWSIMIHHDPSWSIMIHHDPSVYLCWWNLFHQGVFPFNFRRGRPGFSWTSSHWSLSTWWWPRAARTRSSPNWRRWRSPEKHGRIMGSICYSLMMIGGYRI